MSKQLILFKDLGVADYQEAWDYQENLLHKNIEAKALHWKVNPKEVKVGPDYSELKLIPETTNYLLFVEHPPVYTLGKSGNKENVLLGDDELKEREIQFFHTNRGGDITYHGPGQIVGYPILDLEKFTTDIGIYLRNLEEVMILTMKEYGLSGERSSGETGVWIQPGIPGKERKICAIGVRCSKWITMHGFAFNVNTDLSYFNHIIPCGIVNKQVTSLQKELGHSIDINEVKERIKRNFEIVFDAEIKSEILF
jgi:lipoyl(octanoyl) transferase